MMSSIRGKLTLNEVTTPPLSDSGLNMLAIFDLDTLPLEIVQDMQLKVENLAAYNQLLVFGHAGKQMWHALQQSPFRDVADPIDSFSLHAVQNYFSQQLPNFDYRLLYPGSDSIVPLQTLGELAGWHHASPFRIGINAAYGSWFAYRVVVLANTKLKTTANTDTPSPCLSCEDRPCISSCPAHALNQGDLSLQICIDYRLRAESRCKSQCLSRLSCPIAKEMQYDSEQINYHYDLSMKTVEQHRKKQ